MCERPARVLPRSVSGAIPGALPQSVPHPQREQAEERGPLADAIATLPIEHVREVTCLGRSRVLLGTACATTARALPVHRRAIGTEPVVMAEDPTRTHRVDDSAGHRGADGVMSARGAGVR